MHPNFAKRKVLSTEREVLFSYICQGIAWVRNNFSYVKRMTYKNVAN
jgi:hypothetical protein